MSATSTAERLRRAGERVTRQRLEIAEVLAASNGQMSALDLYERVRRRRPGIGRATVFRTLDALVAAGVARRLEVEAHVSAYVACAPEHHHHLACDRCGRVEEIGEAYIRPIAAQVEADLGFRIDDARVDFYGLCAECSTDRAG